MAQLRNRHKRVGGKYSAREEGKAAMKGQAFLGIKKGEGRWREKDSKEDTRVKVSLGGDQEEEHVMLRKEGRQVTEG